MAVGWCSCLQKEMAHSACSPGNIILALSVQSFHNGLAQVGASRLVSVCGDRSWSCASRSHKL